ncbi:hypothetical protein J6590_056019 [Homalodisca vitripennis]|nr:hypothetical protein J6590_056019 [Homalodisca vitripennis]
MPLTHYQFVFRAPKRKVFAGYFCKFENAGELRYDVRDYDFLVGNSAGSHVMVGNIDICLASLYVFAIRFPLYLNHGSLGVANDKVNHVNPEKQTIEAFNSSPATDSCIEVRLHSSPPSCHCSVVSRPATAPPRPASMHLDSHSEDVTKSVSRRTLLVLVLLSKQTNQFLQETNSPATNSIKPMWKF